MAGSPNTSQTITTAIPAGQRISAVPPSRGSMDEDAPALVAEHDGVGGSVPDAVELAGREGQVAATAAAVDEAGGAHALQLGPQSLVLVEEVGRDPGGGRRAGLELGGQLGLDGFGRLGDRLPELLGLVLESGPLPLETSDLGVEWLSVLHRLEDLVLDGGAVSFERGHVGLHRLQLTRGGDGP